MATDSNILAYRYTITCGEKSVAEDVVRILATHSFVANASVTRLYGNKTTLVGYEDSQKTATITVEFDGITYTEALDFGAVLQNLADAIEAPARFFASTPTKEAEG